ncbi:NifU family protein [Streptomyces sp. NPDC005438]|uniref:NifU family protein n=1 Tax=Streptomyces sp. NPDC005438 TaxID=3156880 RepID=UPI0033AAEB12
MPAEPAPSGASAPPAGTDDTDALRGRVARTEELLSGLESLPQTPSRERALDAVSGLLDLYGECLARTLEHARTAASGAALVDTLAGDELVGHLLLVHGLHPQDTPTRVRGALESATEALRAVGVEAELLGVDQRVATVALTTGGGCGSTREKWQTELEQLVAQAAPEVEEIRWEVRQPAPAQPLIPVDALFGDRATARSTP